MKRSSIAIVMVLLLAFSCSTTEATTNNANPSPLNASVSGPEVKAEAPKAEVKKVEAPKAEPPKAEVKKVEAPKAETKVEIKKATAPKPVAQPTYYYVYNYAGYEINIKVSDGKAEVTYPAFITDQEIATSCSAFAQAYKISGVTYRKAAAGKLIVSFPKGYTKADFDYVASIASKELTAYLNSMFGPKK